MKTTIAFIIILAAVPTASVCAADTLAGKQIFESHCASCHSVRRDAVGPALKDVDKRRTEAWIIHFVHSSQTVIKSGDTAAVRLFLSRNKTVMPDQPKLTDDDIRNIIAYVKQEGQKVVPSETNLPTADYRPYPGKTSVLHRLIFLDIPGEYRPIAPGDYIAWLAIAAFVVLLVAGLYVAVRAETVIHKTSGEKPD